jgi:type II secretory pathway pseudopilin PulG
MRAWWLRVRETTRERVGRDDGFTMIDMVVTMVVLGIVMGLFTSAMFQIYGAEERTESTSTAQSQIVTAFQRLDKQVRYASGISTQGLVGSDQYVEFQSTYTGTAICTELRVHAANHQLQSRTWTSGMSPLVPSAWLPLAYGVTSPQPFTFSAATPTFNFQRLEITLAVTSGINQNATVRQSDITFTALNTSLATVTTPTLCTEGRAVA